MRCINTSRGKNALKILYIRKILSVIDGELDLMRMKVYHSESFQPIDTEATQSPLLVIPKFPNLGIMGMTEILSALILLGGITNKDGKRPSIIAFSEVFEKSFGFKFNGIYDRQSELFKRKPYNLTKTLDALKTSLIKEYKKRKTEEIKNKDERR